MKNVNLVWWLKLDKKLQLLAITLLVMLAIASIVNNYNSQLQRKNKQLAMRLDELKKSKPRVVVPTVVKEKDGLHLEGIMVQDDHYITAINGQVLSVGDSIEEFKVIDINEKEVTLINQHNQQEKILILHQPTP